MQYNIAYSPYGELTHITDKDRNSVSIGTKAQKTDNNTTTDKASAADKTDSATEASVPLRFLYNGQLGVQTDKNGLYYMRARYYNTDIKRFINRDTVSGDLTNSQSLNRYAYVQGNPINQTDPFGLYPIGDVLNILSQAGHMILDAAGFFWDGFDLINAAWYQAEGNELMAMTCAVSAIPFMGSMVAGGTRLAFKGSKAAKVASKAADYIGDLSKLIGYTGQTTISAINTAYSYQDYKSAKANGTATFSDGLNVVTNALSTLGGGICALSAAGKMTARLRADGVGARVKASVEQLISGNNKNYVSAWKNKGSSNTIDYRKVKVSYFDRGGRMATTRQIRKYKKQMASIGINVVVDTKGKYLTGNHVAAFDRSIATVYIRRQPGVLDLYHEGFHVEQYLSIGKQNYEALKRIERGVCL